MAIFRKEALKHFYEKYERHIGSLTIIIGFVFDNVAIRQSVINTQTQVFLTYIILAGLSILILHWIEGKEGRKENYATLHFWIFLLMQFSIGSLFSMFFVFYSRGVSIATSWPFLLLLFGNLVGNELFKKYYSQLSLQVSLYFIGIFSFFIYFMPTVLHEMSVRVFIYSGITSLLTVFVFMRLLELISIQRVRKWRPRIAIGVLFVYLLINVFYFTNIIPPVPLVMKEGGVYHNFSVNSEGDYVVEAEQKSWSSVFDEYPIYHRAPNEIVYVVTSVFAPAQLDTTLIHDWQYFDPVTKKWQSESKVKVPIVGGREGGYRFYSLKQSITSGKWRVDVETTQGQIVGQIKFEIVDSTSTPSLSKVVY